MAGVAAGVALQVVLVLGFGVPELRGRADRGDNLAGPQPGGVDVGNGVQRNLTLIVIDVEDLRAVARSEVVALLILGGRIMNLEEELQQGR